MNELRFIEHTLLRRLVTHGFEMRRATRVPNYTQVTATRNFRLAIRASPGAARLRHPPPPRPRGDTFSSGRFPRKTNGPFSRLTAHVKTRIDWRFPAPSRVEERHCSDRPCPAPSRHVPCHPPDKVGAGGG